MNKKLNVKIKRKDNIILDIKRNPFCYLMILPAAIYTFIFGYCTLPYIAIAFQKFNFRTSIFNSPFVGLKNFEFFFNSKNALYVTLNTIRLNSLFILFGTILAVSLSILMNEIKNKYFLKVTQSVFILPTFVSWVIASVFVYDFFSSQYGVINSFLSSIGWKRIEWYTEPKYWTGIFVMLNVWKSVGLTTVIYLAAIIGIDQSYYEAAELDGASRWGKIRYITLPFLYPTISILTLLSISKIFYGDFGMIYSIVRDNGLLFPTTDVIDTYVFRALRLNGDISNATAVGLYQSVMGMILVIISNSIVKKYQDDSSLF